LSAGWSATPVFGGEGILIVASSRSLALWIDVLRFVIQLLGALGFLLLVVLAIVGVSGTFVWRSLRQRTSVCPHCGSLNLGSEICVFCSRPLDNPQIDPHSSPEGVDPRRATVDVKASDVSES